MDQRDKLKLAFEAYRTAQKAVLDAETALLQRKKDMESAHDKLCRVVRALGLSGKPIFNSGSLFRLVTGASGHNILAEEPADLVIVE